MVRHILIFIYLSQIFSLRTILNEVVTVERMNENFIIFVFLVMVRHILIFIYLSQFFALRTILNEVVMVERINEKSP